jgi:hypothetical protein
MDAASQAARSRGPDRASAYSGRTAALATMHGKEQAIAPPLGALPGIQVRVAAGIDTDTLGTFTGEVERPGDMLETARRKARLGMLATGSGLGIASEGAYGPHPVLPFIASGSELMIFIDDARRIEIVERIDVDRSNFSAIAIGADEAPDEFLRRAGFPGHALVVSPHAYPAGRDFRARKGLRTYSALRDAIREMATASDDGKALVQTDMRAHMNPTRMRAIGDLARRLADRLMCYCPDCNTPGFGLIRQDRGLPCGSCNLPTRLVLHEVHGCAACSFETRSPRPDGQRSADPQYCDYCNP